jgi:predicted nucleic acid-binding Zn ribbon protein
VESILSRYATGEWSSQQLADEYGVNKVTVQCILRGKTWTHIKRPEGSILEEVRAANQADHSRWAVRGEENNKAKITEDDARQIVNRFKNEVIRQEDLAHEYGVTRNVIRQVLTGKTWMHLNLELPSAEFIQNRQYRRDKPGRAEPKPKVPKSVWHDRVCGVCSKEFRTNHVKKLYCTYDCTKKANAEQRRQKNALAKGALHPCPICGTLTDKGENGLRVYCSVKCNDKAQNEKRVSRAGPLVTKQCVRCDKEFETTRQDQTYCSKKCRRRYWEAKHYGRPL